MPTDRIKAVLHAGETLIGENKVQELIQKYDDLTDISHATHFIGHLQTNKIREVIKYANCIQSADRFSLAQKLEDRLQKEGRVIDIFIQVNTSGEASKFGVNPHDAISFMKRSRNLIACILKDL